MTNGAKYLPDSFKKSTDSTNYKLLQLLHLAELDAKADFNSIIEYRNIKNAYGKTLDRYGEMVGISRSGATDEQYRLKIRGKLARMASDGTCNKIISLTADIVGVEPENISIKENDMSIAIKGITLDALKNTGCKSAEITSAIAETLSVGVSLEPPVYEGNLLVMGDVVKISDTEVCSVDRNGNYQFVSGEKNSLGSGGYGVDYEEVIRQYPTLRCAVGYGWAVWQRGLSGDSIDYTVTEQTGEHTYLQYPWKCNTPMGNRTFEGGTLGLVSGEDA